MQVTLYCFGVNTTNDVCEIREVKIDFPNGLERHRHLWVEFLEKVVGDNFNLRFVATAEEIWNGAYERSGRTELPNFSDILFVPSSKEA